MPSALFRFDASPVIGAGHALRSLVLADELAARGWTVRLAVSEQTPISVPAIQTCDYETLLLDETNWNDPAVLKASSRDGYDVAVIDHYALDAKYESALEGWAKVICIIDDLADRPHAADLLLDQTAGREESAYAERVGPDCQFLLGSDYALIRKEFITHTSQALTKRMDTQAVRNVLVSFGYTDPSNATSAALAALKGTDLNVTIAIGSSAPHLSEVKTQAEGMNARVIEDADNMAALMVEADLAIGAAGSTSWERCCLGLPAIAVITGDDQVHVAAALQKHGAALVVEAERIGAALKQIDLQAMQAMTKAAVKLCNGGGAARVAQKIEEIVNHKDQSRG